MEATLLIGDLIFMIGDYFSSLSFMQIMYCLVALFMWSLTTLMSRQYFSCFKDAGNLKRFYIFSALDLIGTLGVFLSENLFVMLLFFELMAFAAYFLIVHDGKDDTVRSARTYLFTVLSGALLMIIGVALLYGSIGTLSIDEIAQAAEAVRDTRHVQITMAGICMLVGFGSMSGLFPFHAWLPKIYHAHAPASALFSGMLTKTGLYGLILIGTRLFKDDAWWGQTMLVLGFITMILGGLMALFSNNIKHLIACSSISQVGLITIGISLVNLLGDDNALAIKGTAMHMLNHSLFKLLLFMIVGVIYMNTHKLSINDLRGFGRKKPLLMVVFIIGAAAISGIPLFSGYASKTLIHEALVELIAAWGTAQGVGFLTLLNFVFIVTSGLTLAYMLKVFIAVFVQKHPSRQAEYDEDFKNYASPATKLALVLAAAVIFVFGILTTVSLDRLGAAAGGFFTSHFHDHVIDYFSAECLKGSAFTMASGILIYLVFVIGILSKKDERGFRVYRNVLPVWIDIGESVYLPFLKLFYSFVSYISPNNSWLKTSRLAAHVRDARIGKTSLILLLLIILLIVLAAVMPLIL